MLWLKSVFDELDHDGDGEVTRTELRLGYDRLGRKMTEKEVEIFFSKADIDRDGKINFDGYIILYYFLLRTCQKMYILFSEFVQFQKRQGRN